MLSNFSRINLPYGLAKNNNNEWMAFNREYMPLGYNNTDFKMHPGQSYTEMPIYTEYSRLTDNFLLDLAGTEKMVSRDDDGKISKIYFYDDASNPSSFSDEKLWKNYFDKLQKLSKVKKA